MACRSAYVQFPAHQDQPLLHLTQRWQQAL
jgi:hypothetical protein